ncbi:MAG: biotin--[acetyl-CoA-carboxylase] ligase, partial [Campylobacteraceae bacterium]|nr:biotin--[acetyl-CoA-carboxylase] ligase [Campylobacteraceae bacterium]
MKIIELDEVNSTHIYLKECIEKYGYSEPLCILASHQTSGIGSRGNSWTGKRGNLFFSFVIHKDYLPLDLPMQSASIYFSYILKIILEEQESKIWLKWPNDFYIDDKKIGGTITSIRSDLVYCGIGLNLNLVSNDFGHLDIKINKKEVLKLYFERLKKSLLWKQIFSEYKIEFQ